MLIHRHTGCRVGGMSRDVSLVRAVAGGLFASGAILAANQGARALRLTGLDLPRVLGLSFRRPGEEGIKLAGGAWYFATGGVMVPTLYWLGLRAMDRAGTGPGLLLGLAHYLGSGLLLAATDPERPKERRGPGRPMGAFLGRYGWLERATNLVGHLGYGAVVGWAAARS